MGLTDCAIQFIVDTDWENVPAAVQHQAKRCLMDTLGALIAGNETPVREVMTRVAKKQLCGDEATILVSGERVSVAGAVLVNGFAANALDIDDGHRLVKGHPGACTLPVILAAGEMVPSCSGKAFLTALVIGYEIGIRAGLIRHALYRTYHSSGSWGAISGAAVAGKLLGLDKKRLFHAMGTAEYHAPIAPMMKGIATPSMGKDSIGWGALVAILSVLMAREGFTGITPLFDDTPQSEWVENLGREYKMMNVYFKPYAACRWAQPAVVGSLKIVRENRISSRDIRDICVRTFEAATKLPCTPPENTEQAQYNLSFPVAAALIDGEVGPKQVLPPRLYNSQILDLADRVHTEVSINFEKMFPSKACAEVVIETHQGKIFNSGPVEAMWEPPDTLPSDSELEEKFHWLVDPVLGQEKTDPLAALIWDLDKMEDLNILINHCLK
ncbi:MAG: MmgE/PrpD family protein [Deltaproteobacteria bacterium]|nr:MmgE/PrpD family protein [Deltaproteobacteria bacterium]